MEAAEDWMYSSSTAVARRARKPMPRFSLYSRLNDAALRIALVKMTEIEGHEVGMYKRKYLH